MKNLLILLLIGFAAWKYLGPGAADDSAVASAIAAPNANGFSQVLAHEGAQPGVVYVFAARNCPKEAGQRADNMARELNRRGVRVQRISHVSFVWHDNSEATRQKQAQVSQMMKGELPIVILDGMGRANPDLDSVLAEVSRQSL